MSRLRLAAAMLVPLAAAGCSSSGAGDEEAPSTDAVHARGPVVLYTIGVSSDPHGSSSPHGFGIAAGLPGRMVTREVRDASLGGFGGATWIGDRILVPRTGPLRRPLVFRHREGALVREGPVPFSPLAAFLAWSPDGRLVAYRRIVPCSPSRPLRSCYRMASRIRIARARGGEARPAARESRADGWEHGWTPDGRLFFHQSRSQNLVARDVATGETATILDRTRLEAFAGVGAVTLGPAAWSVDGRYVAVHIGARWPRRSGVHGAFVVARADGSPVRLYRSRFTVSMLAWSPTGHRLAYTTSGFPAPHQLLVVDRPGAAGRRLMSTERHFDWITWSPDSRTLLVDDEHADRWLLVPSSGGTPPLAVRRLGGRPLWCCPQNPYATAS